METYQRVMTSLGALIFIVLGAGGAIAAAKLGNTFGIVLGIVFVGWGVLRFGRRRLY